MTESALHSEGRRARKKRQQRENILTTATRLFSEKGFAETRVEEIAAELDISAATVFNYFGNKDALLLALAEQLIDQFESQLDRFAADENAGISDLTQLPARAAGAFKDGPNINRRLYVELIRVTLPHDVGGRITRRVHAVLEKVMQRGQERGEIRRSQSPALQAEIVADLLTGTLNNWLNDPGCPLGERLERAISFLHEALREPPR